MSGNLGRVAGGGWQMGRVKGRDLERESAVFASGTKRSEPSRDLVSRRHYIATSIARCADDLSAYLYALYAIGPSSRGV